MAEDQRMGGGQDQSGIAHMPFGLSLGHQRRLRVVNRLAVDLHGLRNVVGALYEAIVEGGRRLLSLLVVVDGERAPPHFDWIRQNIK